MSETKTSRKALLNKIIKVIDEMGLVAKTGSLVSNQTRYKFVKIEEIQSAMHEPMNKQGLIYYLDNMIETIHLPDPNSGNKMTHIFLSGEFVVTDGEGEIRARVFGEAKDTSDKAMNKAITSFMKNGLRCVFRVVVGEQDGDSERPGESDLARPRRSSRQPLAAAQTENTELTRQSLRSRSKSNAKDD